jgi:DNA phosphorothioation-dependent restriction protein DptG
MNQLNESVEIDVLSSKEINFLNKNVRRDFKRNIINSKAMAFLAS